MAVFTRSNLDPRADLWRVRSAETLAALEAAVPVELAVAATQREVAGSTASATVYFQAGQRIGGTWSAWGDVFSAVDDPRGLGPMTATAVPQSGRIQITPGRLPTGATRYGRREAGTLAGLETATIRHGTAAYRPSGTNGTPIRAQIRAENADGSRVGPWSGDVGTTPRGKVGALSHATAAGDGFVRVVLGARPARSTAGQYRWWTGNNEPVVVDMGAANADYIRDLENGVPVITEARALASDSDTDADGDWGGRRTTVPAVPEQAPPTNPRATGRTLETLTLGWTAAANADGYLVRRGDAVIAETAGTTVDLEELTQGVAYDLTVAAYRNAGDDGVVESAGVAVSATTLAEWPEQEIALSQEGASEVVVTPAEASPTGRMELRTAGTFAGLAGAAVTEVDGTAPVKRVPAVPTAAANLWFQARVKGGSGFPDNPAEGPWGPARSIAYKPAVAAAPGAPALFAPASGGSFMVNMRGAVGGGGEPPGPSGQAEAGGEQAVGEPTFTSATLALTGDVTALVRHPSQNILYVAENSATPMLRAYNAITGARLAASNDVRFPVLTSNNNAGGLQPNQFYAVATDATHFYAVSYFGTIMGRRHQNAVSRYTRAGVYDSAWNAPVPDRVRADAYRGMVVVGDAVYAWRIGGGTTRLDVFSISGRSLTKSVFLSGLNIGEGNIRVQSGLGANERYLLGYAANNVINAWLIADITAAAANAAVQHVNVVNLPFNVFAGRGMEVIGNKIVVANNANLLVYDVPRTLRNTALTLTAAITNPGDLTAGGPAVDLSATIGGTASGDIVWIWTVNFGTLARGSTATPSYTPPAERPFGGRATFSLTVGREGQTATTSLTINIAAAPVDPSITLDVDLVLPAHFTAGIRTTLRANIGGTATGTITRSWQALIAGTALGTTTGTGETLDWTPPGPGTAALFLRVERGGITRTASADVPVGPSGIIAPAGVRAYEYEFASVFGVLAGPLNERRAEVPVVPGQTTPSAIQHGVANGDSLVLAARWLPADPTAFVPSAFGFPALITPAIAGVTPHPGMRLLVVSIGAVVVAYAIGLQPGPAGSPTTWEYRRSTASAGGPWEAPVRIPPGYTSAILSIGRAADAWWQARAVDRFDRRPPGPWTASQTVDVLNVVVVPTFQTTLNRTLTPVVQLAADLRGTAEGEESWLWRVWNGVLLPAPDAAAGARSSVAARPFWRPARTGRSIVEITGGRGGAEDTVRVQVMVE